jgi:high-affinity Fe2+/Pb2+ permease
MTDSMQSIMGNRVACVLGVMIFAILMALRGETSSFAARLVMAMIAFSVGGIALSCIARSRAVRRRREQS